MDIPGGDREDAGSRGEARERGDATSVAEHHVVLQLDRDIARAEPLDVTIEERARCWPLFSVNEAGKGAASAAGDEDQTARMIGEKRWVEARLNHFGSRVRASKSTTRV